MRRKSIKKPIKIRNVIKNYIVFLTSSLLATWIFRGLGWLSWLSGFGIIILSIIVALLMTGIYYKFQKKQEASKSSIAQAIPKG